MGSRTLFRGSNQRTHSGIYVEENRAIHTGDFTRGSTDSEAQSVAILFAETLPLGDQLSLET